MKKLLLLVVFLPAFAFAGDDFLNRPDLFGTPPAQWNYSNFTTTTTVKSSSGVLHTFTLNSASTWTYVIFDNTAASGNKIATIAPASSTAPYTLTYDAKFNTGLSIGVPAGGTAPDITVTYR